MLPIFCKRNIRVKALVDRHSFVFNASRINNILKYANVFRYSTSDSSPKNGSPENPFEQLIKEKKELMEKQNPVLLEKNEVDFKYLSSRVEALSNQVKVLNKKFHSLFIETRNPGIQLSNSHLHHIKNTSSKKSEKSRSEDNFSSINVSYFEENAKTLQNYWNEQIRKHGKPNFIYLKQKISESSIAKVIDKNIKYCRSTIGRLSVILNDITGYAIINTLKEKITDLESEIGNVTKSYKSTKNEYTNLIDERNSNSKMINELLIRKNNWSNEDLQRFTELYTNEHKLDQKVIQLTGSVKQLEDKLENLQDLLIKEISKKNNEEYLWNIKMRILSSWVTVGLMILNILILVFTHWILEPLKIKRTLNEFENQFDFDEKLDHLEYQIQNLNVTEKQTDSNNNNFKNSNVNNEFEPEISKTDKNFEQEIQTDNLETGVSPNQMSSEVQATTRISSIFKLYDDPENWKTYINSFFANSQTILMSAYTNPKTTYLYLKESFVKWLNFEYNISNLDMIILIGSIYTAIKFLI